LYETGEYTTDGSTSAILPGSSTTIEAFDAIGEGSVSGFNMVYRTQTAAAPTSAGWQSADAHTETS
jgi:hypothetical protein